MTPDYIQLSLLAMLQGFTEFLPISSSGHLLLPTLLLGWPDQGLAFDVAVHVGSLSAVVVYLRHDITRLLSAWIRNLRHPMMNADSRMAWFIIVATIPGGVAGLLLNDLVAGAARSIAVVGTTSIIFALLLWYADSKGQRRRTLAEMDWRSACLVGLAQALALIPGTSRSGITMTAALLCNMQRDAAARFSFLLSIPIITASGLFTALELAESDSQPLDWVSMLFGTVLSAIVAFICIHYFLRLIGRIGFMPFVIYRMVIGVLLLGIAVTA